MLLSKRYASRGPVLLALGALLVLLGLAWHLYEARVAYYDLAYNLFEFIRTKSTFAAAPLRFVSLVTQLPVVAAIRAGWSLEALMRLHSCIFILYHIAVFLVCAFWVRNEQVALVLVLLLVLISSRIFYWTQSEFPLALAALLLYYAGVARQAPVQASWGTLALAALVPVFIYGHPLCIFPFLFLWVYDWLLNRRWRDGLYYGLLAWGLLVNKVRNDMMRSANAYEASQMTFEPNLRHYFPEYLSLESYRHFWYLWSHDYLAMTLLLLVLSVFYLRQRTWLAALRLATIWGAVLGLGFIISVSRAGYTEDTYLANLYLPLTIFVAVPFAGEVLPALERYWAKRGPVLVAGIVLLLLATRLLVLWQQREPYLAYQRWLRQLLTYTYSFGGGKFLMQSENVDPRQLRAGWPWWAMASETMLLSALHAPDSVQTVRVDANLDNLAKVGAKPGVLLAPFDERTTAELPARYFHFAEAATYRVLNTEPPHDTAALGPYIAARRAARLRLVGALPSVLQTGHTYTVPVQLLVPRAAQPLHSGIRGPHPTMLRTAFYKAGDWPSDTNPVEIPLEVDVWHPWTQTVVLEVPHKPGRYTLEISLVSRDYQPWPVHLRWPVDVTP
jgi:hypothetical protein